jgi:hypothetical protein
MATYISNQTGLWSTASTWVTAAAGTLAPTAPAGISPQSFGFDKIVIRGGHTVTYDVSGCFGDETSFWGQGGGTASTNLPSISANSIVLSGGTLKASRTVNTELTAWGNINIGLSGVFDWGTRTDPLTTNANITLHYMSQLSALSASTNSAGIHLYGGTVVTEFFRNGIYLNGTPKIKNTTLAVSGASGSSTLSLSLPISTLGWSIGDRLIVAAETLSSWNGQLANIPATMLSATFIQSFPDTVSGYRVNVSVPLNANRSAGTSIGNFSSNVNIKSFNPLYPAYGVYINGSMAMTVDIANVKLENMCYGTTGTVTSGASYANAVGWMPYAVNGVRAAASYTGNTQAMLAFNVPNTVPNKEVIILPIKGIIVDNCSPTMTQLAGVNQPPTQAFYLNGRYSDYITVDDASIFLQNPNSTLAINLGSLISVILKNTTLYRSSAHGINISSTFPSSVIMDNVRVDTCGLCLNNTYGLAGSITNSIFRHGISTSSVILPLDAIQNLSFKNCTFITSNSNGGMFQTNSNAVGNIVQSNCYYYLNTTKSTPLTSIGRSTNSLGFVTGPQAKIDLYQPNNSTYDYRRFNYFYYSQTDLTTRKRGITTYKIKPEVANTEFYNYFTIPATTGDIKRIKGSLRFDTNYGSTYPPSISFVGAGVNTVFTCASTANVWQDFDLSLSATSTDDILMTITCQSSGTNGFVWLDGLPFNPFIQDVKHYGFVYDKNLYRTINTLNTLTENQVSALATVSTLDYLYDAASYWSVTNPASSSYIDLFTVDNSTLYFYNKNIIFDSNASTVMSYNSSNNNITIKTSNLYSQSNFDTIFTTGSTFFLNNVNIQSDVKIRSLNYDSEITYSGVDYVILYKSSSDVNNSINPGLSSSNGIIRYKYGTTTQGIPMSGVVYAKWYSQANNISGIHVQTLNIGTTDLGDLLGYQVINSNFNIINNGIKNASVLIPHTKDINIGGGLTEDLQSLVNNQQIINNGLKKASILIPYT